jgi:beta-lactamase regulating signal transducer with metallopeptidase domain
MAAIMETLSTDLFYRLGWVLLHSLWQFALIAVLLAVAMETLRRRSAALRYLVCCCALASTIPAAVATYALIPGSANTDPQPIDHHIAAKPPQPTAPVPVEPSLAGPVEDLSKPGSSGYVISSDLPGETAISGSSSTRETFLESDPARSLESADREETTRPLGERWIAIVRPWLPIVVAAWIGGVLLLSIRNLGGWFGVMRLTRMAREPTDQEVVSRLQDITAKMKLRQSVRLIQSAFVEIPVIIGWWRPVLLIPVGMATGMSPLQLDSLLAHELAHVRRHDYLINLFQTAMETLLFYHPAIWWISRKVRVEREYCCDDVAVAVCGDGMEYARALATFEERRSAPQVAVAASDGNTLARVRRIMGISASTDWTAESLVGTLAVVMVIATTITCYLRASEAAVADEPELDSITWIRSGIRNEADLTLRDDGTFVLNHTQHVATGVDPKYLAEHSPDDETGPGAEWNLPRPLPARAFTFEDKTTKRTGKWRLVHPKLQLVELEEDNETSGVRLYRVPDKKDQWRFDPVLLTDSVSAAAADNWIRVTPKMLAEASALAPHPGEKPIRDLPRIETKYAEFTDSVPRETIDNVSQVLQPRAVNSKKLPLEWTVFVAGDRMILTRSDPVEIETIAPSSRRPLFGRRDLERHSRRASANSSTLFAADRSRNTTTACPRVTEADRLVGRANGRLPRSTAQQAEPMGASAEERSAAQVARPIHQGETVTGRFARLLR